jgi:hypothetical protein
MSITNVTGTNIAGSKARSLVKAASSSGSTIAIEGLTPWFSGGAAGYTVTGPGFILHTQACGTITIDGVAVGAWAQNGSPMIPFRTSCVIASGYAHGVYTTVYGAYLSYPATSTKTLSSAGYGGTSISVNTSITTSSSFLFDFYMTGMGTGSGTSTDKNWSGSYSIVVNGASTGSVDKTLAAGSWGIPGGTGVDYGHPTHYYSMMVPFVGTIKALISGSGTNCSGSATYNVIWK